MYIRLGYSVNYCSLLRAGCRLGNKSIVKEISAHFDSGEKLSDEQVRDILRSRKHMSGFDLCHQLYLSTVDLELYSRYAK